MSTEKTAEARNDGIIDLDGLSDIKTAWLEEILSATPEQLERDIRLFSGKTDQYMFISSATVYKKPPTDVLIQESCTLNNPYWIYAQQKIACEEALTRACREKSLKFTSNST